MDLYLNPTGKEEEEVVNIHPRTTFIPQEGWSFLSAGKNRGNSVPGLLYSIFMSCDHIRWKV